MIPTPIPVSVSQNLYTSSNLWVFWLIYGPISGLAIISGFFSLVYYNTPLLSQFTMVLLMLVACFQVSVLGYYFKYLDTFEFQAVGLSAFIYTCLGIFNFFGIAFQAESFINMKLFFY